LDLFLEIKGGTRKKLGIKGAYTPLGRAQKCSEPNQLAPPKMNSTDKARHRSQSDLLGYFGYWKILTDEQIGSKEIVNEQVLLWHDGKICTAKLVVSCLTREVNSGIQTGKTKSKLQ